jgi:peptide deformylase
MALLTVLEYPDKRLRNKALPVVEFDAEICTIVDDMYETMYAENAVGLAATQVNIHQRILVMDITDDRKSPFCLINPEILHREGTQFEFEGCISFPDVFDKVERSAKLRVRAEDQHGRSYELDAEGLLAICIQHEMDHLDGILFIDHLSRLKQERLCKKLEKLRSHAT